MIGAVPYLPDPPGAVRWLGRAEAADSHAVLRDLGLNEQEIAARTSSGGGHAAGLRGKNMTYRYTEAQQEIRETILRICADFDDEYWLEKDRNGGFPHDLHKALADGGWLGIALPEEVGGAGLGITEAAIMMQAIAESGSGASGASAIHMNIFGLNPVVKFGTSVQKQRMLVPLLEGREKACFAVTEPTTGLDTTKLKTWASHRVTGMWSMARRSGFQPRRWRTRCCCWPGPRRLKR